MGDQGQDREERGVGGVTPQERWKLAYGLQRAVKTYLSPVPCFDAAFTPDGMDWRVGARNAMCRIIASCYAQLERPTIYRRDDPFAPLRLAWAKPCRPGKGLWAK